MSELHFPNLTIKGFRGIRELTIPQLGRVNLITGKNNTGKSSILEALRLRATNGAPKIIYETLEFREEVMRRYSQEEYFSDLENLSHVSPLFHGFPQNLEEFNPIIISTAGALGPIKVEIGTTTVLEKRVVNGGTGRVFDQTQLFEDSDGEILLSVDVKEHIGLYDLDRFLRFRGSRRLRHSVASNLPEMPCVLVGSLSGERTGGLANHWDAISLTSKEQEVVEALRIIDSRIAAISMVGLEGYRLRRRAIVRAKGIRGRVPLRTFGDGMNRLFGIVLSLVNAQGGLLLVDEFENGLHYSVQPNVWRMIFELSQRLNVQVFATTHSKDTVHAFQKAAAESPEEGALVHLTSRRDDIIPTVFTEPELAIVARDNIEVR